MKRYTLIIDVKNTYYQTLMDGDKEFAYLGEPEDRTFFHSNLSPIIDRLNEQNEKIAELEKENAKLLKLIGFIPKGNSCLGCDSNVGTIGDYYTTSYCDLFEESCFNDEKCAACLADFPDGNQAKENYDGRK